MSDYGWCPTCQQHTVIEIGRPCAWCDTTVVKKRGGWRRPDRELSSHVSSSQARALHVAHLRGLSLRELSRKTWETLGYSSPDSALEGIRAAFKRERLLVRSPAAATAAANKARSTRLPNETKQEMQRRRRREVGYRDTRTGEWRLAGQPPSPHKEKESFVQEPSS